MQHVINHNRFQIESKNTLTRPACNIRCAKCGRSNALYNLRSSKKDLWAARALWVTTISTPVHYLLYNEPFNVYSTLSKMHHLHQKHKPLHTIHRENVCLSRLQTKAVTFLS